MKRLVIFGLLAFGMIAVMRKMAPEYGPAMRARCVEMCDQMLDNMPESFPPNRMMADLDSLKEETARILDMLEDQSEG